MIIGTKCKRCERAVSLDVATEHEANVPLADAERMHRCPDGLRGIFLRFVEGAVHRESKAPIDLAIVLQRVAERRAYATGLRQSMREIVSADSDMLEACAFECSRLRTALAALREVVAKMRPVST